MLVIISNLLVGYPTYLLNEGDGAVASRLVRAHQRLRHVVEPYLTGRLGCLALLFEVSTLLDLCQLNGPIRALDPSHHLCAALDPLARFHLIVAFWHVTLCNHVKCI